MAIGISIEKFYGQTVIYFRKDKINEISDSELESLAREVFGNRLEHSQPRLYRGELDGVAYCSIELPSVREVPPNPQLDIDLPGDLVERVLNYKKKLNQTIT